MKLNFIALAAFVFLAQNGFAQDADPRAEAIAELTAKINHAVERTKTFKNDESRRAIWGGDVMMMCEEALVKYKVECKVNLAPVQ